MAAVLIVKTRTDSREQVEFAERDLAFINDLVAHGWDSLTVTAVDSEQILSAVMRARNGLDFLADLVTGPAPLPNRAAYCMRQKPDCPECSLRTGKVDCRGNPIL